tara:strand:- start:517 stop:753 length:237 start_codon:yes stop_codon:yes gene_type:complete
MPQIGWFEILLIIVVSILVVGPKDFPIMLKKIGSWIGSIKKYFTELQNEISGYEYDNEDTDNLEKKKIKEKKEKQDEK